MFIASCSLLENTVGVNGYFPGAFVILFAMGSTHGNVTGALRVFGAIVVGAFVGQNLSYLAGRVAADHVPHERRYAADTLAALGVFWHPVLGSAYSFSVGRQSMPHGRFLGVLGLAWIPWNVFWGVLMYNVGRVPISPSGFLGIFAVYLAAWLILALIRAARAKPRTRMR
jgi:membrane protein DedA with SNARE-associated domain